MSTLTPAVRRQISGYLESLRKNARGVQAQMQAWPERYLLSAWGMRSARELLPFELGAVDVSVERERFLLDSLWLKFCAGFCFLLALVLLQEGLKRVRQKRAIENLPTVTTAGMSCGLLELKGKLRAKKTLVSPLSQRECVYFHYSIYEDEVDGENKRRVCRHNDKQFLSFELEDGEGRVKVEPDSAEILTRHETLKTLGSSNHQEYLLLPDDELYVIGSAMVGGENGDELVIQKAHADDIFIISNSREEEVMLHKSRMGMAWFCFAFVSAIFALLMGPSVSVGFSSLDFMVAALGPPLLTLFVFIALHFNDLVFLRRRYLRNWSNIEIALQKRGNLVDGLHSIAGAYLAQEGDLLKRIGRLRSLREAILAKRQPQRRGGGHVDSTLDARVDAKVQQAMSIYFAAEAQARSRIRRHIEATPALNGREQIAFLLNSMARAENEIAQLREGYNDAVEIYNRRRRRFPDLFLALLFGFTKANYFSLDQHAE